MSEIFENPEFTHYIKFPPGGCHLIPKENILRFNKIFYEDARLWVSWEIRPGEAFLFERGIQTIFTSNWIIKDKYLNVVTALDPPDRVIARKYHQSEHFRDSILV